MFIIIVLSLPNKALATQYPPYLYLRTPKSPGDQGDEMTLARKSTAAGSVGVRVEVSDDFHLRHGAGVPLEGVLRRRWALPIVLTGIRW